MEYPNEVISQEEILILKATENILDQTAERLVFFGPYSPENLTESQAHQIGQAREACSVARWAVRNARVSLEVRAEIKEVFHDDD